MKNLILVFTLIALACQISFAQLTEGTSFPSGVGTGMVTVIDPPADENAWTKTVFVGFPISLAKSSTYYSGEFDLAGFFPFDTTHLVGTYVFQATDSLQFTATLEVKNSLVRTLTTGGWFTAATITLGTAANLIGASADSLYSVSIVQRGSVASGVTDIKSMGGKIGNRARIKIVVTNPTTVGNSGSFRSWLYLKKRNEI